MLTLAVTSSTAAVGVAVGRAGASPEDVAHRALITDRRHSEELTPMVAATLAEAEATIDDIELFAADVGPGRFTGLRVGLATVRTLALATGRPVVGVSSLEALAAAEPDADDLLAVIDARRAEVFQQRFIGGRAADEPVVGRPEELVAACAVDPADGPPERLVIVGDGADRYRELYGPSVVEGRNPSAAVLVSLAADREPVAGVEVAPLYLRDPDVNVNVKTRHSPR
ncbi:MAG: tRNA (adenosine(37)-N6)-threonylcarbamoyltransferase complex dimerization subunit type 1 TsaB [Actinomycetota bacterium]